MLHMGLWHLQTAFNSLLVGRPGHRALSRLAVSSYAQSGVASISLPPIGDRQPSEYKLAVVREAC